MGALRMRQRAIATTLLLGAVSAFHMPGTRLTTRGRARNVLQTGSEVAWKEFGALPPGDWRTAEGPASSVIVGGGPAGMATAIMFAKRGWRNIVVVDRLGAPPDPGDAAIWGDTARFYLVGLGARGQRRRLPVNRQGLTTLHTWTRRATHSTSRQLLGMGKSEHSEGELACVKLPRKRTSATAAPHKVCIRDNPTPGRFTMARKRRCASAGSQAGMT